MKLNLPAIFAGVAALAFAISGCSTMYRTGQTPDDVYYSPARAIPSSDYVVARSGREDARYDGRRSYNGYDDFAGPEDRWLMMRVRNRMRWSAFDDYFYSPFYYPYAYNSWGYGYGPGLHFGIGGFYDPFGLSFYNQFNSFWLWNSYYNPYHPHIIVVNPKINPVGYNKVRTFNPGLYSAPVNTQRAIRPVYQNANQQRYNNINSNRRLYRNDSRVDDFRNNDGYRPSNDRPVRTYSPSSESRPGYSPSSSPSPSGARPSRR